MLYHQHDSYWQGGYMVYKIKEQTRGRVQYSGDNNDLFRRSHYRISETESFAPSSHSWRYPEDFDANFTAKT